MPYMIPADKLPLELPEVSDFKPTESGEPPLGHAAKWAWDEAAQQVVDKSLIDERTVFPLELCTMPGFAGSSAYYLRYMDPTNAEGLVSAEANNYWQNVDLYLGGSEHATGHLIYSRFWNKFLFDLGVVCREEPFKKLVNQGMIQGRSNFVYRIKDTNTFVSATLKDQYDTTPIHVDVNIVTNDVLDLEAFKAWRPEYANAEFILDEGKYTCGWAVEKMSKSMFNVVNPDDIVEKYGADTLRLYEMFLGPIEQSKPWDTAGIDGSFRFLKKFWGLYFQGDNLAVEEADPSAASLKSLHKLIKKVTGDIESFSYNTAIPAFMIAVSELQQQKCHARAVLEPMVILIAPFAPHIAEELWHRLGHETTVCDAPWPKYDEKYLVESEVSYPISFGGKVRLKLTFPADMAAADVQAATLANPDVQKWMDGKEPKKVIVVPGRIVNIVL
jgi:leucyl-tRNA synthetase